MKFPTTLRKIFDQKTKLPKTLKEMYDKKLLTKEEFLRFTITQKEISLEKSQEELKEFEKKVKKVKK